MKTEKSIVRCGIVLAGGEGKRLRPYIHRIRGDRLPKQYVNFTGGHSMLDHTVHRCEKLISPERLFTVVDKSHMDYEEVQWQLSHRPEGTVILQPENKETGPGILLPLIHIYKHYPESVVTVFPSDHYIREEDNFIEHVNLAFRAVEQNPSLLVLLGLEPHGQEYEYGYILPGEKIEGLPSSGLRQVIQFVEKPEPQFVPELIRRGGMWNTLVLTFKSKKLLELIQTMMPRLYSAFQKIWPVLGTSEETKEVTAVYEEIKPENFSKGFLQHLPSQHPSSLAVLPVLNVFWSEWGSEQRILRSVQSPRN